MRVESITVQEIYGRVATGICDQCAETVTGNIGIGVVMLEGGGPGIIVGICKDEECVRLRHGGLDGGFHPLAQIPLSRLNLVRKA